MFAHFSGKMRQYQMAILIIQFDAEHGIGKGFLYDALHLYSFFFRHKVSLA
jgi:hypothetical protein